jgi:hypothetical protein
MWNSADIRWSAIISVDAPSQICDKQTPGNSAQSKDHSMPRITFQFLSGYRGESDFMVYNDPAIPENYRVHLRFTVDDADRKAFNEQGWREVLTSPGILRCGVHWNDGQVSAEVLSAFNDWRAAEFAAMIEERRARISAEDFAKYYAPLAAPTPAVAGHWSKESGWTRIEGEAS